MIPISKPQMSVEELAAVTGVLESGQLAQGEQVAWFESAWAAVCQARECIAVTNGTVALQLMLQAYDFIPGGEVITSPFTFWGTIEAIISAGLTPVFVDIDIDTYNLDPLEVKQAMTHKTVAILPVHLYGLQADMPALREIADTYQVALLEDACQAHGLPLAGDAAAYSFYATKNITTGGEGGAIVTDDASLAERLRLLRNHYSRERYQHLGVGYNARMTELQAAIGLQQIKKLRRFNAARAENAAYYNEHIQVGIKPSGTPHVWHQYTLRVKERATFCQHLQAHGIGYGIYYPTPCHRQGYCRSERLLQYADYAAAHVVSIPVHPGVTAKERKFIVRTINQFAE